jgi:Protein of unknown function (DUF1353)
VGNRVGHVLIAFWALSLAGLAWSAEPGVFSGRVVVEVVDEIEFVQKLRLLENFVYTDSLGRAWPARKGSVLDGETIPRELIPISGLPHVAEFRKTSVIHDYFSRLKDDPWRAVHRMLYDAAIAEGVAENQARVLYAAVYAGGWRWEPLGSSCYRGCHVAASMLAWKPKVALREIEPLVSWLMQNSPSLDDIDKRVDAALKRPGPHVFAQLP